MTWPNIHHAKFEQDPDPPGYRSAEGRFDGKALGAAAGEQQLTVRVFEVPPGQSLCPYHYEYAEEWLLMIGGELQLRTPSGEEQITDGDLVCFRAGPQGAHKVTNAGAAPARFMMWSPKRLPEVIVYPDSDKIAVFTGNEQDDFRFLRESGNVPYFEGELGAAPDSQS